MADRRYEQLRMPYRQAIDLREHTLRNLSDHRKSHELWKEQKQNEHSKHKEHSINQAPPAPQSNTEAH